MLADRIGSAGQAPAELEIGSEGSSNQPPTARRLDRAIAFAGAFALVVVFAIRGGSYDLVVRQEAGLVIWWILAVGFAIGLLPRSRPSRSSLALAGSLLLYAAWTAISLFWTESAGRTTAEVARVLDYAGLVVLILATCDRRTWRSALAGLGFGAMIVCVLALASRLHPAAFPVDRAARVFRADRLDYPFGYWNAVSAWGAMCVAFGLAWSAHDDARWRRALALALVPIAGVVTYLAYSRSGVAAVALAVVVVLALSRNRVTALLHAMVVAGGTAIAILVVRGAPQIARATGTKGGSGVLTAVLGAAVVCAAVAIVSRRHVDRARLPRSMSWRLGVGFAVIAVGAAGVFGPRLLSHAWHSFRHISVTPSSNPTQRLTNLSGTRYNLWRVALDGFDNRPATGTGAGTYQFWWLRNQRDPEFVRNAHSLWLENMEELGAPGLLLIVAVAIAALALGAAARRRSRRNPSAGATTAALAVLIVYLLVASVDWMWQSTAVTVFALGGTAVIGSRLSSARAATAWPARVAVVAVALCAGAIQIPGLVSTTQLRRSQAAARSGKVQQAVLWANAAVESEPWASEPYLQRALLFELQHRFAAAATEARHATSRQRTDFENWLILARIEVERGRYHEAVLDYEQARRLGRQAQVFQLAPSHGLP